MKKVLIRLLGLVVVVGIVWFGVTRGNFLPPVGTAFAVGDLTIDWGVPAGDPIFVVDDFAPGEVEMRTVQLTNNATIPREVGVVGTEVSETGGLGDQLEVTISVDGVDVYGGTSGTGVKTLNDFVADGSLASPIALTVLDPGETEQIVFTVKFKETAGNEFQGESFTLDISLGLTGAIAGLPAECAGFDLSNANLIMGTEAGEILRGTAGPDVIFGLEGGDYIVGNGGDDCLIGGLSGDLVKGGSGDDIIFGNEAGDSLQGGDGHDLLFGNEDGDNLEGGRGNDVAFGGSGGDRVVGGSGNDELFGEEGQDAARGGTGTDRCEAESEGGCEL